MKCLLKLSVLFALALVLFVVGTILGIESLTSTAITESVGFVTQQETQLQGVDIEYGEKLIGFEGLTVANPPGFQEVPVVRIGNISAQFAPAVMHGEAIHLKEVRLEGLELALELSGSLSNISDLLQRLDELNQSLAPAPGETSPNQDSQSPAAGETVPPGTSSTNFKIDRILVTGVKATLRISDVPLIDGVYSIDVPDMLLEDFDSSMDAAELTEWTVHVLGQLLTNTLAAGDGVFPSEWQSLLQDDLSAALLSGDLGKAQDVLTDQLEEAADELLKEATQDGVETIEKAKDDLLKSIDKKLDLKGIDKKIDLKGLFKD